MQEEICGHEPAEPLCWGTGRTRHTDQYAGRLLRLAGRSARALHIASATACLIVGILIAKSLKTNAPCLARYQEGSLLSNEINLPGPDAAKLQQQQGFENWNA